MGNSPECVEGLFSEVRGRNRVLGTFEQWVLCAVKGKNVLPG